MVDILWKEGNTAGAIHLEELWNELAQSYEFSLLCAYAMGNFYKSADGQDFHTICQAHSHVRPTEKYSAANDELRLIEITLLQQRAASLENEVKHREELEARVAELESRGRLLEAQRIHQRTMFDLEMIQEIGYCHGIENYARHLTGRNPGDPPPTLLDYLPQDSLLIVDESHQTVPQIRGMYAGDRSRTGVLVASGFRLPSALDNRPLKFPAWEARAGSWAWARTSSTGARTTA